MAFLLNKASTISRFASSAQKLNPSFLQSSLRGFHIELGAREKAEVVMRRMSEKHERKKLVRRQIEGRS